MFFSASADGGGEGYTYDFAGNVTGTRDANGGVITYRYNSQGKVCEITNQESNSETFRYDREGRMVLHVDRNGSEVRTTYNVDGNGETLAAYAHTPGGRLKEIRHGNGIRTGYEYDTDGNLVHLHMEHTDGEILADLYYSHDLNGNRTLKSGSRIGGEGKATEHKVSYVYDRMDRLVSETRQGEETAYVPQQNPLHGTAV